MRNKERIKPFLQELGEIWEEDFTDWRFGQLCSNFFSWLYSEKKVDIFFPEEEQMMEYFREFAGRGGINEN